jgi:hypothetical protein
MRDRADAEPLVRRAFGRTEGADRLSTVACIDVGDVSEHGRYILDWL